MLPSTRIARILRRASGGHLVLLASALAIGLVLTGLANATLLPPSSHGTLLPSLFQGGDGNQTDETGSIDWQGLEATPRRVHHAPDPDLEDSAFEAGQTAKILHPGDWKLTVEKDGVDPKKANILDAWSSFEALGPDAFLYLAFARAESGPADTFLTFELNHDRKLWFNGHSEIPCRQTGDILVALLPAGNRVNMTIHRWVTTAWDDNSGCATEGTLQNLVTFDPTSVAQGATNEEAISNFLPGFYQGTIPEAETFAETSLNLVPLLGQGFGNPCVAFTSFWMHSRSSGENEHSTMQDYVAPNPLTVRTCSASGMKFWDENGNGVKDEGEPGLPRYMIWRITTTTGFARRPSRSGSPTARAST